MQTELETRLQHMEMLSMEQENTLEILNREVHRQQRQIQALEHSLELLKTQLASINKEPAESTPIEDEMPPPHY